MRTIDKTVFRQQLTNLINQNSLENESNTPDFIIAEFLVNCLEAFNKAVNSREEWYGRKKKDNKELGSDIPF